MKPNPHGPNYDLTRRDTIPPAMLEDSTDAEPVGSSTSMLLNTIFKHRHSGTSISIAALVDSGATNCYMDKGFVDLYRLPIRDLSSPLSIYNADGSENTSGCILSTCTVTVQIHNHTEDICFYVTALNHPVILGFAWLSRHNPLIDWRSKSLTFSRCPSLCYKRMRQPSPETPDPTERPDYLHPVLRFEPETTPGQGDSTEQESTPIRKRKRSAEERPTGIQNERPRRSARHKERVEGPKTAREGRGRGNKKTVRNSS
ncbi:hypothetical protein D9611_014512 [Ephemerocybe angulata]|uniref:Uncharacterized protein n=1 Tax=Ephemerocybe angulata TaxID=980116 RepID=A0A8H5BX77_9AGAR|nr:hypothetical protein D9611_010396 [Tulosesus angulatus]KAF5334183.1 hypothetical protein D9611_014512 [Tulosesus angulatus]